MKKILKLIVVPILAGLLTYLGQSNYFLENVLSIFGLSNINNLTEIKECLLIIGIIILVVPNAIYIYLQDKKNSNLSSYNEELQIQLKELLLAAIKKAFGTKNANFEIHFFVKKESKTINLVRSFFKKDQIIRFRNKYINGLTTNEKIRDLEFEVHPKQEGLVALCYQRKNIVYDDNLASTNETNYNLTSFQKTKTNHLRVCICVPIIDKTNKVVAILTIDSSSDIKLKINEDIFFVLTNFANSLESQFNVL